MKLVIFGLTISSSWGNGHATLWRALCRALAARGHDVTFFEQDRPYYAAHRDLHEMPGGRLVFYAAWEQVRPIAARELADADAAIVTSYCADALAAAELLGEANALRVFYDLDTPVTLDALQTGRVDYLGPNGLAGYDLVLSYTGGSALDELHTRLGARHVAPLYGSVDPDVHRPATPHARFFADLSYLGTYAADRQGTLEALFIEPARCARHRRFLIGGAQYPTDFPWQPNIFFVQHLEPAQHPAFFSSSRLTLNVTRRAMKAMGYCPSGRLFEAAACGAPVVSDWWEGLDQFFHPEKEIFVARGPEDVLRLLDLSDAELTFAGRSARARVLAEHTATHRAAELEQLLDEARHAPQFAGTER
ncbi:MAG: glycosyltransferase [Opitutus sp.]|nr:glycosyltransferase [Opitutus sp.]